ncbi:DUF6685 family protein [Ralstonia sp.]|uniref:DUF6685 family protein n=1 Tax=Ralstonia sp. TaxID=54061 RepID=UPI00257B1442|nr:DUF6685 family protein [Ralstonia sp.]MBA4281680.1 hypothetical protein [Ralstonia sp.]
MFSFFRSLVGLLTGRSAKLAELARYASMLERVPVKRAGIGIESVFPWHRLGSLTSTVLHWHPSPEGMRARRLDPSSFQFTRLESLARVDVDIRAVQGISASKERLEEFDDIDSLADARCRGLMTDISEEHALKLLRQPAVRLMCSGKELSRTADGFVWHQWDGRLFFDNCDGSHHFAAARRVAGRAGASVKVGGPLRAYSLDTARIVELQRQFDLFFVGPGSHAVGLYPQLALPRLPDAEFHTLMGALSAEWIHIALPESAPDGWLLALPCCSPRSQEVARVLRRIGFTDVCEILLAAAETRSPAFLSAS